MQKNFNPVVSNLDFVCTNCKNLQFLCYRLHKMQKKKPGKKVSTNDFPTYLLFYPFFRWWCLSLEALIEMQFSTGSEIGTSRVVAVLVTLE